MGEMTIPRPAISVERVTPEDLKEALSGTNGNPSYEEQFGITATPLGQGLGTQPSLAELELAAAQAEARAVDPNRFLSPTQTFDPSRQAQLTELEVFKKKYGDSENEKGALRRENAELLEAFNGLSAQFEAMRAAQVVGPPPNQSYQQQYAPQPQFDPFTEIGDDDVVQGRQMKQLLQNAVVPAFVHLNQQAEAAMRKAQALETQLVVQAKTSAGINKLTEYRLTAKNPWLNGLPEPNKIAAMQALMAAEKVSGAPAEAGYAQTPAAQTQERILSRTTYIEGTRPQVADVSQAAVDAAYDRDYAKVMSLPAEDGSRARAFRELNRKYNLGIGEPSDLAR